MRSCNNRTKATLATIAIALVLFAGCSDDGAEPGSMGAASDDDVQYVEGSGDARLPASTLQDVVTYSEAFARVRVESEDRRPMGEGQENRTEGLIGRDVVVSVVETYWSRPGARKVPEQITFVSDGWALHDGEEKPMVRTDAFRLEVGEEYAMPLTEFAEDEWGPLAGTLIVRVAGGKVVLHDAFEPFAPYAGHPPARLAEALDATEPDPRASPYLGLPSDDRYARVLAAEEAGG